MPSKNIEDKIMLGQIVVADELASPLPLEHTSVEGQVVGPLVTEAVTQRFGNPLNEPAELSYLFPLPEGAAIVDFELHIGERVVRGEVDELEKARRTYQQALDDGKHAGLMEQRRPNLFAVNIANVIPGEVIKTLMRYQERLKYQDGEYEFVFPMGITPKYGSPEHPDEDEGVTAPVAVKDDPISPVEISLSIDAGAPFDRPASPSHAINVTRLDERRFNITLADRTIPERDFVLRYAAGGDNVTAAAWRSKGEDGDYFLATLLPPPLESIGADPMPREFIFVLDRSGSMSGEPIAQARNALRACLRSLNEGDIFRILLFDHELAWYKDEPSAVTQEAIDEADGFLGSIEGRGGTEIVKALEVSLTLPPDTERTRFLVFLTDGAVSGEGRALEQVRKEIGAARLFTFGIGPSVNRALLNQLARLGRGTAAFLQLDEDIEEAILRFQDRVSFPALTDITLKWKKGKTWDVYPALIPDLYVGQPLEIAGRLQAAKAAELMVSGRVGGGTLEMALSLPPAAADEPVVRRAWVRARLDELLDQETSGGKKQHKARSEIISLSLEHHLITPYTAFTAVDPEVVSDDGKPVRINVSQPLPQGLSMEGFFGPASGLLMAAPTSGVPSQQYSPQMGIKRAFMRDISKPDAFNASGGLFQTVAENMMPMGIDNDAGELEHMTAAGVETVEKTLKRLARTQNLNGSWQDDVEMTAAALLAFVRSGHTTHKGHYRKQVGRAVEWLAETPASGLAAFAAAAAAAELAQATGNPDHREAADKAAAAPPTPTADLEKKAAAALQQDAALALDRIETMDDLRLAVLYRLALTVPEGLLMAQEGELARVWAAGMRD